MSYDRRKTDKYVVASVCETGFVGVELTHTQIDNLFDKIHRGYQPEGLAEIVSRYVDKAPEYPMIGGWGHRVLFGHSLSSVQDVYDKFGLQGVLEWSKHLGADFCSPHGLPLPLARHLKDLFDLNTHEAVQALCMNVTDTIACGFGLGAAGLIPDPAIKGSVALAKLWIGIAHSDPTLILTATAGVVLSVAAIMGRMAECPEENLDLDDFREVEVDPPSGLPV